MPGITVTVVEPQIVPAQLVTVAVPGVTPKAWPRLLRSLVRVVIVLSDELHVAVPSVWVLLSLNVPVAVNTCAAPAGSDDAGGVSAIDTRPAGVTLAGMYNSPLEEFEPVAS